jgi:hypothetical protein
MQSGAPIKIGRADQKMSHHEFLKLDVAGISASAPLFAAGCLGVEDDDDGGAGDDD